MSPSSKTAFISYARSDYVQAARLQELLEGAGVHALVDVTGVDPGFSFVCYIEKALSISTYCFLLWSRAAQESRWVQVEYEAALHRTVCDSPGFLVVCRLEDILVPALLRPRVFVDLFPEFELGVERVLSLLKNDATAEERASKRIGKPRAAIEDREDGVQIYVTSKLFGRVFPLRVRSSMPVIGVLQGIVDALELPRVVEAQPGIGVRFEYALATSDETLRENASLGSQGIKENDVIWLQTTVFPFGSEQPIRAQGGCTTWRSKFRGSDADLQTSARISGEEALYSRIRDLGLDLRDENATL